MKSKLRKLIQRFWLFLTQDHGQDMVEYALIVILVAFGVTAGMNNLATGLNSTFNTVSTKLSIDL